MPDTADNELLRELADGVLTLTINRPDRGNALPWPVRERMQHEIEAAHRDPAVRCVLLSAAGDRHFCTGADLSVPPPAAERPEGAPDQPVGSVTNMMRNGFPKLVEAIHLCEKPVIAAVNGTAAGGGASIVLACDLVLAADHARIIQVFVRRGLVPDSGAAYLLQRLVGVHKAKELLFFGDDLDAADAERLGIFNKVVPADELAATAREWAARLATGPTKAFGFTKKLLNDSEVSTLSEALDQEAALVELNSYTADAAEGLAAFRERRKPEWKGW